MPQLNSEDAKAENKAMLGISPKPQPKAELTTDYTDATDKKNLRNPVPALPGNVRSSRKFAARTQNHARTESWVGEQ